MLARTEFKLEGTVGSQPLTATNVPLPLLREFLEDIEILLKGDSTGDSLAESKTLVESGSLRVAVLVAFATADNLAEDMDRLDHTGDLDAIQPRRAALLEEWQARTKKNHSHRYAVAAKPGSWIAIHQDSPFARKGRQVWAEIEKYLVGKVVDLGGKTRPTVHLVLAEDEGRSVRVDAKDKQLAEEVDNHLYKMVTLRVRGEQNLKSGELRNLSLIEFMPHSTVDAQALEILWANGRQAWKDVPSATAWVEELRGHR